MTYETKSEKMSNFIFDFVKNIGVCDLDQFADALVLGRQVQISENGFHTGCAAVFRNGGVLGLAGYAMVASELIGCLLLGCQKGKKLFDDPALRGRADEFLCRRGKSARICDSRRDEHFADGKLYDGVSDVGERNAVIIEFEHIKLL